MKFVVAPDKFKGCLAAPAVSEAIAAGIRRADPRIQIESCPMADGGEGTVEALVAATGGRIGHRVVTGPLPEMRIDAAFGILGDRTTAVIEMAAASGLALLPIADRNPMATTTFGTGELIRAAIELGVDRIILGLGGSATNDGGIGCAQACGHTIILEGGDPVSMTEPLTGSDVSRVVLIKRHRGEASDRVKITVASDVNNILCGPAGASHVFGPQKGATPAQVLDLDRALNQLARRCGADTFANTPGAGAAGGLGFGLMAFFGAEMRSGFSLVAETTHLAERLAGADLCITGEGSLDGQSAHGKTAIGVARLCESLEIPCIVLAGTIGSDAERCLAEGVTSYFGICSRPMDLSTAMEEVRPLLESASEQITRLFLSAQK